VRGLFSRSICTLNKRRLQPRAFHSQAQTRPFCWHPSGALTHLPPVPPFLLTQNLSPKDIDGYDIRKLKVSRRIYVSLVGKGLRLTLSFETAPDLHLLSSLTTSWKSSFWSLKLLSKEWEGFSQRVLGLYVSKFPEWSFV